MNKSAIAVARQLLASNEGGLEELRLRAFSNDEDAHDGITIERLRAEFISDVASMQSELSASFGEPSRAGTDDDQDIPLCGVFRFAVWRIEGRALYVAAAHEDRECPILLMLGITSR